MTYGTTLCPACDRSFSKNSTNHAICSKECRKSFYVRVASLPIATASVGSISEMRICCKYLAEGYSVFRSVSNAAFCDVVAIKGDENLHLEVRTGYKDIKGGLIFPKKIHTKIAVPTHYAVYIPATDEIEIIEISEKEKKEHKIKNLLRELA